MFAFPIFTISSTFPPEVIFPKRYFSARETTSIRIFDEVLELLILLAFYT